MAPSAKRARAGKNVTGGRVFDVVPRKAALEIVMSVRPRILGSDISGLLEKNGRKRSLLSDDPLESRLSRSGFLLERSGSFGSFPAGFSLIEKISFRLPDSGAHLAIQGKSAEPIRRAAPLERRIP